MFSNFLIIFFFHLFFFFFSFFLRNILFFATSIQVTYKTGWECFENKLLLEINKNICCGEIWGKGIFLLVPIIPAMEKWYISSRTTGKIYCGFLTVSLQVRIFSLLFVHEDSKLIWSWMLELLWNHSNSISVAPAFDIIDGCVSAHSRGLGYCSLIFS